MAFRIIFMFICIAAFINSCGSLVSQKFGSHRLQVMDMKALRDSGIGSTDFIQLSDAQITGDFVFAPGKSDNDRTVVLYPLVDTHQLDSLRNGQRVSVSLVGWEHRRPGSEADTVSISTLQDVYRGLVQSPGKRFEKVSALDSTKYGFTDDLVYVAIGRHPVEWHWNVAVMAAAAVILFLLVSRLRR